MMLDCIALLVGTDPRLAQAASEAADSVVRLRLEVCPAPAEALARLGREDVALVLVHLAASPDDAETTRFISAAAARPCPCAVVLLSDAYRDHQALAFLRAGAIDYLALPLPPGRLAHLLDTLTLRSRFGLRHRASGPAAAPAWGGQAPFDLVLDPGVVELVERVRRVVPQDTPLLFTGETGTGKTRLARLVHELSPRRDQPFLAVDCGALSPGLIESE